MPPEGKTAANNKGTRNCISTLTGVPVNDGNYAYALTKYASDADIEQAIAIMEKSPQGNKSRITACRRELRKRKKFEQTKTEQNDMA